MAKAHIGSEAGLAQARQWADGLDDVARLLGRRLSRSAPRQRALTSWRGLLRPVERQHGWPWAALAGGETPGGVQHVLGRAAWSGRCGAR